MVADEMAFERKVAVSFPKRRPTIVWHVLVLEILMYNHS